MLRKLPVFVRPTPWRPLLLLVVLLLGRAGLPAQAQRAAVSGTVRDAATNEGIPSATIHYQQTPQNGTTADVDGHFTLAPSPVTGDTLLVVSSIGFEPQTLARPRPGVPLRVRLKTATTQLGEVIVHAHQPENPAYAIIRRAAANKERNSPRHLAAYELESYTRLEVLLTNTAGLQNSRLLRPVQALMARQGSHYRDAQGRLLLPVSVTETVANEYYRRQPQGRREDVVHTQTAGVGIDAGDGVAQILNGSGLRDYDFYKNQVRVLTQSLPSPIADGWHFHYEYELQDSVQIDGETVYRIAVLPRRRTDLVFSGTIWVTARDYALRRLDLHLAPEANINFVRRLRIRQQGQRQPGGVWLPSRTDYVVDLSLQEKGHQLPGIRLQRHATASNLRPVEPRPVAFYEESRLPIGADPAAEATLALADPAYWQAYRAASAPADSLPPGTAPYALIDSIKALPRVRAITYWGRGLTSGYLDLGPVELGPLAQSYAHNNVEGNRVGLGVRTSPAFSRDLNLDAFLAYGTRDRVLKYNLGATRILSRTHFTQVGARFRSDLEPLSLLRSDISQPSLQAVAVFNHWGNLRSRNPFHYQETTLWLEREVRTGLTTRLTGRLLGLSAAFPANPAITEQYPFRLAEFPIFASELELGLRYNRAEQVRLTRGGVRRPLRRQAAPTFALTGTVGHLDRETSAGAHAYQKLELSVDQRQFPVLGLGLADLNLRLGYTFGAAPYALLKTHRGNDSPFLYRNASQAMRPFEFVSDHYAELHYTHFFNNLILGHLPGVRALNQYLGWRLLATTSVVWGGLRPANVRYNQYALPDGRLVTPFRTLGATPYVEVGYGVENIFHVLRVDFIHRLTYRDAPAYLPFGRPARTGNFQIRVSAAFKL